MTNPVPQQTQPQETVTVTIDGVQTTVPKGARIIEAAEMMGKGIAHYCYHPALSAPAMCRMCLVEVEGAPKLQPACVTQVVEGQVIHTESEKAREARQGTLEFYLVNHPLDCPVCDAAGECKLQDFVHAEGRKHGRALEAKRVLGQRSEEHTSELQSQSNLVCRLLLEKKKTDQSRPPAPRER